MPGLQFRSPFFKVICYLYSSVEKPVHNAIRYFSYSNQKAFLNEIICCGSGQGAPNE